MSYTKKLALSVLILIGACAVSVALAFGNYYYYQWINGYVNVNNEFLSALLYSAFLIIIGAGIVSWRPRFYGFHIGESIKYWKRVLIVSAMVCAFTAICLLMTPRTPYSGANWAVEMILVPVSEEMIWRGVIFTLILALLGKLHNEKTQLVLAIAFSSVAFGLAHISNILVHPISFVILQMIFAAIAGSGMGYLRAKTKSVYPAMLVHALFNLVAILF
jgi:membrane protease YdiL (CAAX protease family)